MFDQVFAEAKLWLQPRHYAEIIEERSMEGVCGFPACQERIEQPSTSSQLSLRISYKEKRLYEIDGSVKFCCCVCLKSSAAHELLLEDTSPFSRPVAQELARDGDDLTSNAGRRASPPTFYHAALDPAGAAKITGDTISAVTSALKSFQETDRKTQPRTLKGSRTAALSARFLASTAGSLPILTYNRQEPEDTPASCPSSSPSARPPKAVGFSTDGSNRPGSSATRDLTTTGKSILRSTTVVVTDTGDTTPRTVGAPQPQPPRHSPAGAVVREVVNSNSDSTTNTSRQSPTPPVPSPVIHPGPGAGPDRHTNTITPSIATVAEHASDVAKKMDSANQPDVVSAVTVYDEAGRPLRRSQDDSWPVEVVENHEVDEWAEEDTAVIAGSQELSLFMLLWTALDDFFGNEKFGSFLSSTNAVSTALGGDSSTDSAVAAVGSSLSAKQRSTAIFIEKGFSKAEGTIKLQAFLSDSSYADYVDIKRHILAWIDLGTTCPPLSSSEWALLSLILIDAVVCGKSLLPENDRAALQEWNREVELSAGLILRTDSGRHRQKQRQKNSSQLLRDGDLSLLRSFFPRLVS